MKHEIPGHPPTGRDNTYRCKGSIRHDSDPENRYHPSQRAWLVERNLYTGRMIADIAHLPENLKFLTL